MLRKPPTHLLWIFGPTATLYDIAGNAQTLGPGELEATLKPLRSGTLIVLLDTTLARPILCTMPPLKRWAAHQLIRRYLTTHGPLLAYDLGALKQSGPLDKPLLCIQNTPLAEPWFQVLGRHAHRIHTWTTMPLVVSAALGVEAPLEHALLTVTRVDSGHIEQILLWQHHCWLTRHHPFLEDALASDIQASLSHIKTLGIHPQNVTVCLGGIRLPETALSHVALEMRDFTPAIAAQNLLNAAATTPLPPLHVPILAAARRDKKIAWSGAFVTIMSTMIALFLTWHTPQSPLPLNPPGDPLAQEIADLKTQIAVLGGDVDDTATAQNENAFYTWRKSVQKYQISPEAWRQKILSACPRTLRLSHIALTAPRVISPSTPARADAPVGILQLETYVEEAHCDTAQANREVEAFRDKLVDHFPGAQIDILQAPQDLPHCPGTLALFLAPEATS